MHNFWGSPKPKKYVIKKNIGQEYDTSTDLWSAACMFFELLTGDFLFDPKSSRQWSTDEDQLALMIELLGTLIIIMQRTVVNSFYLFILILIYNFT